MERRNHLRLSVAAADRDRAPHGPLEPPDANGLMLPRGFTSRVVARSGHPVGGAAYLWHSAPAAGACFPAGGGWIYVSNSEASLVGGAGAIRFDAGGTIVDGYAVLSGTSANRSGGATPWHTWLSCEDHRLGQVHETDPWGVDEPVARPAMGVFAHHTCAVDEARQVVYLTEDERDGGLYRFTPTGWPDLSSGLLEVMVEADDGVAWAAVPDPSACSGPTRRQVPGAKRFDRAESCCAADDTCWLTTRGDGRVWAYHATSGTLTMTHSSSEAPVLFMAEDGGVAPFVRVVGHGRSEITGPAFSPDGTRLYFSSQRGASGWGTDGVTFEVTGPFRRQSS